MGMAAAELHQVVLPLRIRVLADGGGQLLGQIPLSKLIHVSHDCPSPTRPASAKS